MLTLRQSDAVMSRRSGLHVKEQRVLSLVDQLLREIYGVEGRRLSLTSPSLDSDTGTADWSCAESVNSTPRCRDTMRSSLREKNLMELHTIKESMQARVELIGNLLVKQLRRRDVLMLRHTRHCDVVTALLQAQSLKRRQDTRLRFSVAPLPGDSGFTQWHDAMKMVARLPGGIPLEFRRRLWLTLSEKHLQARGVDWTQTERTIFNEWSNPDDDELGIQIVKDLHRTGCSLFCGAAGERNQALLKRVLLAYARWNKAVGYCQGFNMLAALILQVMERSEGDSVKVMIYLIEGVLPESYFANNLRGLSVDMAVFRELLRMRMPTLSKHLEQLQSEAGDLATGTSYEPPLTNVFTMQWFLTLFANCLPQATVLRVWDLVFLEGNEVLLRAALAIWASLEDRIMAVDSADEFYSIMGVLTREMLEFGLMDPNNLVKAMVTVAPFPFPELPELRDRYMYNITPWSHSVSNAARRGLRLFQSDEDEPDDEDAADDEKMAVAAAFGISAVFRSPRRRSSLPHTGSGSGHGGTDKERLNLDISALKQQYSKLRERQRQAHIILSGLVSLPATAACARQPGPTRQVATPSTAPVVMNHLLLGRGTKLLQGVSRGGRSGGPVLAGTALHAPQQRASRAPRQVKSESGETLHWRDAKRRPSESVIVPVKSPSPERSHRSSSSSSTTSSASQASSSSTELCDEPDRLSDFDTEEVNASPSHKPIEAPIPEVQEPVVPEVQVETDSQFSSPTEEASTHDEISQISLSPLLLSPSTTLQNSASSTVQNSPTSSSKTLDDAVEQAKLMHMPVSLTSSSKTLEDTMEQDTLLDMPMSPTKSMLSALDSPTRSIPIVSPIPFIDESMDLTPTAQTPENPTKDMISVLDSPTRSIPVVSPIPFIEQSLDLSPTIHTPSPVKPIMDVISTLDSPTRSIPVVSPIPFTDQSMDHNLTTQETTLVSPAKNTISISVLDSPTRSIPVVSPIHFTDHSMDHKLTTQETTLLSPTKSTISISVLDSPTRSIPIVSPVHFSEQSIDLTPTTQSISPLPTFMDLNLSPSPIKDQLLFPMINSIDQATSPIDWSRTYECSEEKLVLASKLQENSPDLIKSHWIIESEKTITSDSSQLLQLDDISEHSQSVFSPENVRDVSPINSLRMVPLGSLSASLSSPSSNEDELNLPDLMVITPPRELSPLSPLKSPAKWCSETIPWDASKFPFPKSPPHWNSTSNECGKQETPEELKWELPISDDINKSNENLISWDIPEIKNDSKTNEEWDLSFSSWQKYSDSDGWKLSDDDWKTVEKDGTILQNSEISWQASLEIRESASDAPASPLPDETKNWHSITADTTTTNASELKMWHPVPPSETTDLSEVPLRDKSDGTESKRQDRKRWTIAEPIAWSAICDAISQQQESKQRPVSPLVEEEEETIKDITPVGALGRRNSERALQIIQENSEILQRIMRESRGKQMMDRASRPTSIGLGGSRGVRWGSQRELTCEIPSNASPQPIADSPTASASWKPSTCFPSLGESPQTSPIPFNPFPVRAKPQTRELGVKLGLYPTRQVSK